MEIDPPLCLEGYHNTWQADYNIHLSQIRFGGIGSTLMVPGVLCIIPLLTPPQPAQILK